MANGPEKITLGMTEDGGGCMTCLPCRLARIAELLVATEEATKGEGSRGAVNAMICEAIEEVDAAMVLVLDEADAWDSEEGSAGGLANAIPMGRA